MAKALIIFGWICVFSWTAMGIYFLNGSRMSADEFVQNSGTLTRTPTYLMDEYDSYYVGMRFLIDGESKEYRVAGKLLNKGTEGIWTLEAGDEIVFYTHGEGLDKRRVGELGLKGQTPFYTLEDTLAHFKSGQMMMYGFGFIVMAVGLGYYLVSMFGKINF